MLCVWRLGRKPHLLPSSPIGVLLQLLEVVTLEGSSRMSFRQICADGLIEGMEVKGYGTTVRIESQNRNRKRIWFANGLSLICRSERKLWIRVCPVKQLSYSKARAQKRMENIESGTGKDFQDVMRQLRF